MIIEKKGIEFLKLNFRKMSYQQLSEKLKVEKEIIKETLENLGLKKGKAIEWSNEDEMFLKENLNKMTIKQLEEHFQVSRKAIENKIKKMELSKEDLNKWKEEEEKIIKKNYLIMEYKEIAKIIGRSENSIRNYCWKKGLRKKEEKWEKDEIEKLKKIYKDHEGKYLDLDEVSKMFNRSRNAIAMKASNLGFSDFERPKPEEHSKETSKRTKKWIEENGHPKGMLGKTHSEKVKKQISERTKKMWADPNSCFHTPEMKLFRKEEGKKRSLYKSKMLKEFPHRCYSNARYGKRVDLNNQFFRSGWEANFARFLNYLISKKIIYKWEYESDQYEFKKEQNAPYRYTPDFKIWSKKSQKPFYYEVKGWMDEKSKRKLERMKVYYPDIKIILINEKKYNAIKRKYKDVIENWEK